MTIIKTVNCFLFFVFTSQLHSELDTAKANIESLNHQLFEVQRSQPLHRAREQHDSLLVGLQQKFSQETANLREKVDAASKLASERVIIMLSCEKVFKRNDRLQSRISTHCPYFTIYHTFVHISSLIDRFYT